MSTNYQVESIIVNTIEVPLRKFMIKTVSKAAWHQIENEMIYNLINPIIGIIGTISSAASRRLSSLFVN